MINALQVVNELNNLLPPCQRPEHTEGYEGFYHLISIRGEVENASSEYIIRDHSRVKFEEKKRYLQAVTALLTGKYGEGVIKLTLKDQYYNMREMVEPYPEVIDKAFQAMEKAGVTPDRSSYPRRYGWCPFVLYGTALSELIYRRYEFPWKI